MHNKTRTISALIINALLFLLGLTGLICSSFTHKAGLFQFYTQDSNIFAFLVSGAMALFYLRELLTGKAPPRWMQFLKYTSVCCLSLTFTIVVFLFIPTLAVSGEDFTFLLVGGSSILYHVICPMLAMGSYILLEGTPSMPFRWTLFALVPTAIYAFVTILLNALYVLHGPYPFLYVHEQTIFMSVFWVALIHAVAYVLALIFWASGRKVAKVFSK